MRLGSISYINVLPVTLGLERNQVGFQGELVRAEPSALNAMTRTGQLDATAVSSIEYLSCWQLYRVVQGVGLSAPAAVQSVKLFSLLPIEQLRTVAVTKASATSRTLLQVLVPGLQVIDLEQTPHLSEKQPAVLLIGDQALTAPPAPYELDLGQAWKDKTGFPMVFAVWLCKRTLEEGPEKYLERSREWGAQNWNQVIQESMRRTGLDAATLESYFSGMRYHLGETELKSLNLFYKLAAEQGLVKLPGSLAEEKAWSV
ncbi:MAG: menaquinone biosynthesis protein [Candidatus Eremiobacteraeota bacterium]|nr:menaquinone biosynthesis protein [Candidatus Eremiobacteraeota bacterium]MCW5869217.1 menaquinone biosynthesis protein [Candidatus Eremiobacteraeota bacterium]